MASASIELNAPPETKVRYCGPAGTEFESFQALATYSMDNCYPNWRNYDRPESYIIPSGLDRLNLNDEARLVFKALQEWTKDEFLAPMMLICGLTFYRHADHLAKLLRTDYSKELGDMFADTYYFILIGPKIEIIVIEIVRSPEKEEYRHALERLLRKSDVFFRLLEKCTDVKLSNGITITPRRFIYAPNVEPLNFFER